jgi:hypothetical protein
VFFMGEFIAAGLLVITWKVVVAVSAGEVATPGDFDGAADGDSLRYDALVKTQAPVLIALGFHARTGYHTTRTSAKTPRKEIPTTKARKLDNTKKGGSFYLTPIFFRAFPLSPAPLNCCGSSTIQLGCFRDRAFFLDLVQYRRSSVQDELATRLL